MSEKAELSCSGVGEAAGAGSPGAWVRRRWCLWLAVGLVLLGAVTNTIFLFNHSPIDLSQDEAHYWLWSQHLDYGYYSKPPGIAWVIAAAQRAGALLGINGDGSGAALMPVIRMPAILFGLISGLLSLSLARRIFRDDRAALAVIVLSAAVPMFAVGSLLITIDSPMYLAWSATVYCLWRAVESCGAGVSPADQLNLKAGVRPAARWLYAAGLYAGVGMLFKPVGLAVPVCVAVAAWMDTSGGALRRTFSSVHAFLALLIMFASQIPVVIWNAHHNWVTLRHMGTQAGVGEQAGVSKAHWWSFAARLGEYIGGQAGGMGGIMFVMLVIAVCVAWGKVRAAPAEANSPLPTGRTRWIFLLSFTLPLWGFYLVLNFWKNTEVNWPAASYFTGMILLAGVFVESWNAADAAERKRFRGWGTFAVAWGVVLTAIVLNVHRLYPLAAEKLAAYVDASGQPTPQYFKSWWHPSKWDVAMRLRGEQSRADAVEAARAALAKETGQQPLLITGRYDTSSGLSFYMPGHPFVYSIMSSVGGRQSQFDIWPGLNDDPSAVGRPAIIAGSFETWAMDDVLKKAFDRIEGPVNVPMTFMGVTIKEFPIYRGYGFKGIPAATGGKAGLY